MEKHLIEYIKIKYQTDKTILGSLSKRKSKIIPHTENVLECYNFILYVRGLLQCRVNRFTDFGNPFLDL